MRSTFHGLEVAKRGLFAQQTGINTTAHNIANANTKGYTRQRVNFTASQPIEMPAMNRSVAPGQLGTGVNFSSIVRLRESFLDAQYRNEASSNGYWTIQKDTLEKIELIFNEPSEDGLRTTIDQFWNAWSDLSREPDNMTARAVVVERARAMLDAFQHVHTKLSELKNDLNDSFVKKVDQANLYIAQIAELNREIRRIEAMGMHANDLRDQRDLLVDELSRLVPINVQEDAQGMYTVSLQRGDGTSVDLVNGINSFLLDSDVPLSDVQGNGVSGELHSLWKSQNDTVQGYINELNSLFASIVQETNNIHYNGYTLDGNNQVYFFTFLSGHNHPIAIGEIEVNPVIVGDLRFIAAASNSGGLAGDGGNALLISQLRYKKVSIGGDTATFDDYYRSILGKLGVQTQEAQRQTNNTQLILDSVDYRRQSVSGVSLDEEMANLVQLQHAYNSSARMVTTVDQMLDTIINRMGVVGR
jgi:flagellar hook-associated protein 1 FlgK